MSEPPPIRLLIADDHPVFRFGLRALIESDTGFEIVGEASDGEEAVRLAQELQPDVALLDVAMPGLDGIEATRRIREQSPGIGVLIITMVDDASIFAALRAGARGYLLKGAEGEQTLRAIRAVAHGEAIFSPDIATRLLNYFANPATRAAEQAFPELTAREEEVLELVARGLTNTAIARHLALSPKTVRNQISTIFSKLGVADRGAAIVRAREAGLGQ